MLGWFSWSDDLGIHARRVRVLASHGNPPLLEVCMAEQVRPGDTVPFRLPAQRVFLEPDTGPDKAGER